MRALILFQGAYFTITGLWAIVSIRTFQRVTGPKTDTWLVKTVGMCVLTMGIALFWSGSRGLVPPEIQFLGLGAAVGFLVVDVTYVSLGRIARIYLADAVVEALIVTAWIFAIVGRR